MSAEVVIVGGGLVGALTAVLLGAQGRQVELLERSRPQRQVGELGIDIRNVAVSPASRQLLEAAGVWQQLTAAPYDRMCVVEERGTRQLEFAAQDVDRTELGWMCEHSEIVCALWGVLEGMDTVALRVGDSVQDVATDAEQVVVTLDSGALTARLLIGADGNQSSVRGALGVAVREQATGHHALATVIRTELDHGGVAWQRFLLDGPLAVLPSCHRRLASVVWSQSAAAAERRMNQDADGFCVELAEQMEQRLGRVEAVDRRLVFPVSQMLAESFNPRPRVLLIGDAARAIHPLAGLGANVGFEDVRELVGVTEKLASRADVGAGGLWESFASQRRARAQMMLALMNGLRRIYAAPDPLTGWLRNVGVDWLDHSAQLKRQFILEAMGQGTLGASIGSFGHNLGALSQSLAPVAQALGPLAQSVGRFLRPR